MLFEILVHLRAQDIYDVTRLICRKWYNMIYTHNFIQAHLQHAPHGLLFHSCDVDSLYVTMQQGRVEIFKSTTFRKYETCMQCDILTVGVDKSWRTIRGPHLSYADRLAIGLGRPMMTQGFIHWVGAGDFILTMNVETEIITRHRRPNPQGYGDLVTYLSTGGRLLSLLIACGELLWEVWEMEPESGEWRKLFEIDLEDDKWTLERLRRSECRKYKYLIPIAWLKYPQVLVFGLSVVPPPNFVLLYNLVDIFDKLDLPNVINSYHRVFLHQNSLVWLTGC
ncbi:hypothetical protein PHJA_001734100 [Phtheirospermum japonicum]|uniref:F-box associated domain-containing protein n=1 Tax=Phtheirospermum japonicum TaxID=374723 RepID=A0A830C9D0_9LAMI|nr:hypothetical protein PHJA_001734100 [Phtheirospermum japonicum]